MYSHKCVSSPFLIPFGRYKTISLENRQFTPPHPPRTQYPSELNHTPTPLSRRGHAWRQITSFYISFQYQSKYRFIAEFLSRTEARPSSNGRASTTTEATLTFIKKVDTPRDVTGPGVGSACDGGPGAQTPRQGAVFIASRLT